MWHVRRADLACTMKVPDEPGFGVAEREDAP